MSEVGSYQCILSVEGLGGPCLFMSVLGRTCQSTDPVCNRIKGYVGPDWEAKKIFYIWNYSSINKVKWRWGPNTWNTVCWTYDYPQSKLKVIINDQTFKFPVASVSLFSKEKMEIYFMNSIEENLSFHGAVTDVQMWSRWLTDSEIAAWAACQSESGGDLIDWSSAQLNVTGLIQLSQERDLVCAQNSEKKIAAFNMRLDFHQSVKFCSNLGEIASAREEREREEMISSLAAIEGHTCNSGFISAGLMWSEAGQSWSEVTTGQTMSVENWSPGRPSNDTQSDNCLYLLTYNKSFYDYNCQYSELCPRQVYQVCP